MSAFVVSRDHIDALVKGGLKPHPQIQGYPLRWWKTAEYDGCWAELSAQTADEVGQMLTDECVRSVSHRYQDNGDLPGCYPNGEADYLAAYHYPGGMGYVELSPVQVLKLINCYEYQSCEHPGWRESEAWRYCEALRDRMISMLPGYSEAAWEWTHPESARRYVGR